MLYTVMKYRGNDVAICKLMKSKIDIRYMVRKSSGRIKLLLKISEEDIVKIALHATMPTYADFSIS